MPESFDLCPLLHGAVASVQYLYSGAETKKGGFNLKTHPLIFEGKHFVPACHQRRLESM